MPYLFMLLFKLIKNNNKNNVNKVNMTMINIDSLNEGIYSINKNLNKVKNKIKPIILKKNPFTVPLVKPFLLSGVSRKNTASSGCGRASGLHGICGIKLEFLDCL